MERQQKADARTGDDEETGDEIARAARIASLTFDGQTLSDDELDELCEAVLSEGAKAQADKKASR